MTRFVLLFSAGDIRAIADRYQYEPAEFEDLIPTEIAPRTRAAGWLAFDDFLHICRWKSPRSAPYCRKNDDPWVKAISGVALSTESERLRIEVLTLLDGVGWPTASALLHFLHPEPYPVLDVRALWSLGVEPKTYDFDLWWSYTQFCRRLAHDAGVTMRTLDRALWQYSWEQQGN